MLKFGRITEVDTALARYRVHFIENDIVSFPLPVVGVGSTALRPHFPLQINDAVACLMDEYCIEGIILGTFYAGGNAAPGGTIDSQQLTLGTTTQDFTIASGLVKVSVAQDGVEIASEVDSLGKLLTDMLTQIALITHGGPGTPPVNAPIFTVLQTRAQAFLK